MFGCHKFRLLPLLPIVLLLISGSAARGQSGGETHPPATGDGLLGSYFTNPDLQGDPAVVRVDPTIDFNWGDAAPDPNLPADGFSVRWTGQIQPEFSETYTFFTTSDDGVRLWVNDQLLVDNWTAHLPAEDSGTIDLEAGKKYSIKMEMFEQGGGAVARLEWASTSRSREVVPKERLFSNPVDNPDHQGPSITEVSLSAMNLGSEGGDVTLKAKVSDPSGLKTVSTTVKDPQSETTFPMELQGDFYVYTFHFQPNTSNVDQRFTITMKATDNKGNTTTRSPGSVTVQRSITAQYMLTPIQTNLRPGGVVMFHVFAPGASSIKWSVEGGDENGWIEPIGNDPVANYHAPVLISAKRDVTVDALVDDTTKLTATVHLLPGENKSAVLYVKQPLTVQRGSNFNLDISLAPDPTSAGVAALQFILPFPQNFMSPAIADPSNPVEITLPDNLLPDASVSVNVTQSGRLRIAIASPKNSTKAGILVRIPMSVKLTAPLARVPINFTEVQAFDQANKRIPILALNGTVTVTDNLTCGDVDGNSHVEVSDAVMALRSVVGLVTLTADQRRGADTNHDGQVTAGDVVAILRISIGLDDACPTIRPAQ